MQAEKFEAKDGREAGRLRIVLEFSLRARYTYPLDEDP